VAATDSQKDGEAVGEDRLGEQQQAPPMPVVGDVPGDDEAAGGGDRGDDLREQERDGEAGA
jgi:hypothetical protein